MKVKSESEVAQTLSDPMDCSLPGSSIYGILQARVLEWVAIAFSSNAGDTRHRFDSCVGKTPVVRHGNSLQYSCLENPRDGGAWWAAVYGVAQSRTRLKQLSSSSMKTYKTF